MKNVLPALSALGLVALGACADSPTAVRSEVPAAPSLNVDASAGSTARHVVLFKGEAIPGDFAARVTALGGSVVGDHGGSGLAIVTGLSSVTSSQLARSADILSVSRDLEVVLEKPAREASDAASEPTTAELSSGGATFLARQWSHRVIGADKLSASTLADRDGSDQVTVAILDSGIDPDHPDLSGLVDAARSISFVPGDANLAQAFFPGRPLWTDLNGHGSHVASTVSSNAVLARGVTSRTKLMAVKVLGARGSSFGSSVFQGILHAADNGADVINMSLGGSFDRVLASARGGDGPSFLASINRVISYANKRGVLVVVSAGNSAIDLDADKNGYKSYCSAPNVICVSATGPTNSTPWNGLSQDPTNLITWTSDVDAPAIYTNYGRSAVHVAAPGGNYAQTTFGAYVWQACSTTRLNYAATTGTYSRNVCATTAPRVAGFVGTSMAAPHVSGLAALLVQRVGKNNVAQLRAAIEQSAADLGAAGVDKFYGKGRIDAAKAMGL